jgi:ribonuclease G
MRDLLNADVDEVLVDDEGQFERIIGFLRRTSPAMADRVRHYTGDEPLFAARGVQATIRSTMERRVPLGSGGYLVIDDTEAMTVIDVNSGRNVGKGGTRLEDTITKTNLEAATEVVRQLRLRDIGGIVIIDFIDMDDENNRRAVKAALDEALARDRTRTYVVDISPLGLVEMTRQNISDGPREIMTEVCPTCAGVGVIASDETLAIAVERELRESLSRRPGGGAVAVTVHPRVADVLSGEDGSRLAALAAEVGAEIRLERDDTLGAEAVRVRSLDDPAAAAPVATTRSGARRRVSSRSG